MVLAFNYVAIFSLKLIFWVGIHISQQINYKVEESIVLSDVENTASTNEYGKVICSRKASFIPGVRGCLFRVQELRVAWLFVKKAGMCVSVNNYHMTNISRATIVTHIDEESSFRVSSKEKIIVRPIRSKVSPG